MKKNKSKKISTTNCTHFFTDINNVHFFFKRVHRNDFKSCKKISKTHFTGKKSGHHHRTVQKDSPCDAMNLNNLFIYRILYYYIRGRV